MQNFFVQQSGQIVEQQLVNKTEYIGRSKKILNLRCRIIEEEVINKSVEKFMRCFGYNLIF